MSNKIDVEYLIDRYGHLAKRARREDATENEVVEFLQSSFECIEVYQKYKISDFLLKKDGNKYFLGVSSRDGRLRFDQIFEQNILSTLKTIEQIHNNPHILAILKDINRLLFSYKFSSRTKSTIIQVELALLPNILISDTYMQHNYSDMVFEKIKHLVSNNLKKDMSNDQAMTVLNAVNYLVKTSIKHKICIRHYSDIFVVLKKMLKLSKNHHYRKLILTNFIRYNHIFLYEDWDFVLNEVEKIKKQLPEDDYKMLIEGIKIDPTKIELKDGVVMLDNPDFTGINFDEITTCISFVIPFRIKKDNYVIQNQNHTVVFLRLRHLYDDPVFNLHDKLGLSINMLPFEIFSESIRKENECSVVLLYKKGLYNPDFDIVDGKVKKKFKDFSDHEARLGRSYHPYKELVVAILRNIKKENKLDPIFDVNLDDININLFSNYVVSFHHKENRVYLRAYTVTNLDAYLKVQNRYLSSLEKLKLDSKITLKKLIEKTKIKSVDNLVLFILKIIDEVLNHSLKYHNLYKQLWTNDLPVHESVAQILVYNMLKIVLEIKGISLTKEPELGNGKLDLLAQCFVEGEMVSVCIELKNAHSKDLESGVTHQLPTYMKASRANRGIYCVLWYKSDGFNKPSKYDSIEELSYYINKLTDKMSISSIILDCSKKLPPSKLKGLN